MASDSNWQTTPEKDNSGAEPQVDTLIKKLMERIEESERRYGEALETLHSRLDALSQATVAAKSASAAGDAGTFDHLHEQVSNLAKRLSDGDALPGAEDSQSGDHEAGGFGAAPEPEEDIFAKLARGSEPFGTQDSTPPADSLSALKAPDLYGLSSVQSHDDDEEPGSDLGLPPLTPDDEADLPLAHSSFEESSTGDAGSDMEFPRSFGADFASERRDFTPSPAIGSFESLGTDDYARRLVDAAQRLEHSLGAIVPNDQITELNDKMTEIAAQLDRALQQTPGQAPESDAFAHIEQQLTELGRQLGRAEAEISRIGGVEDQLNRLMQQIEGQPTQMEDVANRAATEAAKLVSGEVKATAAERLEAIHKDLLSMNERSTTTDDRLADTLTAVHDSLRKLVTQAEKSPEETSRRAPFADLRGGEAGPSKMASSMAAPSGAPNPAKPESPQPQRPDNSLRSQLSAILPDDEDEQPAFGRASGNEGEKAWSKQLREDAHRIGETIGKDERAPDSFVAAARRAAQAAAAQSAQQSASSWTGKAKSKILPDSDGLSAEQPAARKKRSYLMFVAAILLIVSASLLYSRLKSKGHEASPQPAHHSAPASSSSSTPAPAPSKSSAPASKPKAEKSGDLEVPGGATQFGALAPTSGRGTAPVLGNNTHASLTPRLKAQPVSLRSDDPDALPPGVSVSIIPAKSPARLPAGRDALTSPNGHAASTASAEAPQTTLPLAPAAAGPYALRLAAAKGNPKAQYILALRYAAGTGMARNMGEAIRWLRLAALAGLAPAQYRLGIYYERHEGVEFDPERARNWYLRAAEQGNIKAMHNLAVLEGAGTHGKGDYRAAAAWYRKAANHGLEDSQFNLAVLEAHGLGVKKNQANAYKWFAIAAKQGDPQAAKERDALKSQLTAQQLKAEAAAIKAWRPEPVNEAANIVTADQAWASATPNKTLVKQAQLLLNKLGYAAGPADGEVGSRTTAAVITFERRNGLPQSGVISAELVSRLQKLIS